MSLPGEVLKREEEIQARVAEMGARISSDYAGRELTVLGVLGGAFVFMADLVRRIDVPVRCGFVGVRALRRSADVTELAFSSSIDVDVADRDVLVVKDILDTGVTMAYLCEQLQLRNPRSLRLCALLDKPQSRRVDVTPDYYGFQAPDQFVVGYGLEHRGQYRNLPHLTCLEAEPAPPAPSAAPCHSPAEAHA